MFTLTTYGVQFGPPSFSSEQHGDELKPLVSIYAETVVNSANLESFKTGLQDALWKRPAVNDSARLDEDGTLNDLVCRFPGMKSISFEDRFPGYGLTVHKSELFDETKDWEPIEVGKISVTPENGGTARVKFRIQVRGEGLEWFVGMMNRAAEITLTPPKAVPFPADHPDARDPDDTQENLPIGEGAAPDGDPLAGTDLELTAAHVDETDETRTDPSADAGITKRRGRKGNGAVVAAH